MPMPLLASWAWMSGAVSPDAGKGKSKLTKNGGPEVRRLLFNAATQARRNPLWEPYYLALRERGFSTTAAFVALGRKLARVAFALLQKNVEFDANLHIAG